MIKKIVALTLCLVMAFTLLGVITVSASINDAKTVFINDGSSADDYKAANSTASVDDGAIKFTLSNSITNRTRFANVYDLKLFAGGEYVVSFDAKASAGTQIYFGLITSNDEYFVRKGMNDKTGRTGSAVAPNITTEYDTYSFEFSIDSFVTSKDDITPSSVTEASAYMYIEVYSAEKGSAIWIDNLKMTQKGVPEITCSVNGAENGTVSYDGNEVTDGYKFFKTAGKEVTLDITPADGYKAVVTKDGNPLSVSNNKVTFTAEDDSAINIAFTSNITGEMVLVHDTCGTGGLDNFSYIRNCTSAHSETQYKWTISNTGSGYNYFTHSKTSYDFTQGATYQIDVKLGVENAKVDKDVLVVAGFYFNDTTVNKAIFWCENNKVADYTATFTSNFTGSAPIRFDVHSGTSQVGTSIILDEITIKQLNVPKVTVSVGANGTVSCDDELITDGYSTGKSAGSTMTFDVTPANGYKAVVKQDGQALPVNNGQVTITIPSVDTDISIEFEAKPSVNAGIDTAQTQARFTADGIYVYNKISDFTTGESNLNYGIILGNGSWSEWLYALDTGSDINNQIRSAAKPGDAYIIKVIGADISETYTVQAFVGEAKGDERTLSFAE